MQNEVRPAEDPEEAKLRQQTTATIWIAGIVAAGLVFAYAIAFSDREMSPSPSAWGTFGDFMGGLLNPLVAFCALYWLTRSIQIQRRELKDTHKALAEQALTLEKQRFEGTFFSLLEQHNKVLGDLSERIKAPDGSMVSQIDTIHTNIFCVPEPLSVLNRNLKNWDPLAGHYFRILYHIFKLIATSAPGSTLGGRFTPENILKEPPSDEEKRYANIVRAFLGTKLTQLLALNCYCADDTNTYWKYKCLVERYALLEHMPFKPDGRVHLALTETYVHYEISAFGKSEFLDQLPPEIRQ